MDVKQDQDPFDVKSSTDDFIKIEPESCSSQTEQNKYCPRIPGTFKNEHGDTDTTFNEFQHQMTEQFAPISEIDQDMDYKNLQFFPETIKQEFENTSDIKMIDIKQEVTEYMQPKTESVVSELLTSECDLPTLKVDSTDYYSDNSLGHTYSGKPLKNTYKVILKKKRMYTCTICQNSKSFYDLRAAFCPLLNMSTKRSTTNTTYCFHSSGLKITFLLICS